MLRFIGVICDRTAPPLRAGACGSAGREFAAKSLARGSPAGGAGKALGVAGTRPTAAKMANEPAAPTPEMNKLSHPSP